MSYNYIKIDLKAIEHNFRTLKSLLVDTRVGIIAVVKSDAYGHGMLEVSQVLERTGAWGFGISEIEEAIALRNGGIDLPILLMAGLPPGAEREALALDLTPGITDLASLDRLESVAAREDKTCKIHLKVDTGMGRMGFLPNELFEIVRDLGRWPHLRPEGLYSHLSSADDPSDTFNETQLNTFASVLKEVRGMGWSPLLVHLANSAGLIHFPSAHYDLVRPGLAIYGSYPGPQSRKLLELRPAMSFYSKIVAVRHLPKGASVSYGHSFHTRSPSRVAVVPVGYDDGYLRSLSNRAWVLIRERRCPVIGRICMKAFMVDVSMLEGVRPGEEVVLLGRQGIEAITAEELAQWGNTISYEILCLLGTRNKRFFKRR